MLDNYSNKKILITGNTGFKGPWLCLFLKTLGASVIGYSDKIPWKNGIFNKYSIGKYVKQYWGNITDYKKLSKVIDKEKPDLIFHLASQPIVLESYKNPLKTLNININGSINLLDIVNQNCSNTPIVIITSDKVYKNDNKYNLFYENTELSGSCPYSTSKVCVEMVAKSYYEISENMTISTARAGNVIGGGDWSENRIIPDLIRSIKKDKIFLIRNPKSVRPWTHVLDITLGYLLIGLNLFKCKSGFETFNLGADHTKDVTVLDLSKILMKKFNIKTLKILENKNSFNEKAAIRLNSFKIKKMLNWKPHFNYHDAIKQTAEWYEKSLKNENSIKITLDQIKNYLEILNIKNRNYA